MTAPAQAAAQLQAYALGFPEAEEHAPWGHFAARVRRKNFVFSGNGGIEGGLSISAKLAETSDAQLSIHEFATPTGYGLGKAGWVSASFAPGEDVPVDLLKSWIDESYRAIAPKTLVKSLSGS